VLQNLRIAVQPGAGVVEIDVVEAVEATELGLTQPIEFRGGGVRRPPGEELFLGLA
jgi:hypothetical protein